MARPLVLLAVLAATAWAWPPAAAVPPCNGIIKMITPCIPYLMDKAATPRGGCCDGVVALREAARSHRDTVAVCNCLKGAAPRFPRMDVPRAANLPHVCGVHLNFTISPTMDCSKIPST